MKKTVDLGSLLNQTFAEIGQNREFAGVFAAILIPMTTITSYLGGSSSSDIFEVGFGFGFEITEELAAGGVFAILLSLVAVVIEVALTYWLYAAMTKRTAAPGFGRFFRWVGIYILAMLGIAFGFVLFIVPGIILALRWIAVLPLALEDTEPMMDAFGESWRMTEGSGWSLLGAHVILLIVALIATSVIDSAGLLFDDFAIGHALLAAINDTIVTVVFIAVAVGAFRLLKDDREELAEVFE